MSILNRPSDGLFNMVIVLHRTLLHLGAMSKEKLLAIVAPPSVVSASNMATSSLKRWTDLGLFEEVDGEIRISRDLEFPCPKDKCEAVLPSVMRRLVLAPQNNSNLWESEGSRSADMTRATAWMLAQNIYDAEFSAHRDVEFAVKNQLGRAAESVFQNDTRWNGFKAWGPYLGFGYTRGKFVIDPTIAVEDALPQVWGDLRDLPVADFLESLARELPVVDGGVYRLEVESRIDRGYWEPPAETEISTSLSRALLRLHVAEKIRLEDRSDSPDRRSLRLQGRGRRAVTHVLKGRFAQ